MTETTDLLNAGEIVEAGGQAWTLSHVSPTIRAKFSAWLKGRARKELADQRREGILDEGDYRESLTLMNEEMSAGAYNWGSPLNPKGMGSAVRSGLGQTDGKIRLVQLLLEAHHGAVSVVQVHELLANAGDTMSETIRRCLHGSAVPNGQAVETPPKK